MGDNDWKHAEELAHEGHALKPLSWSGTPRPRVAQVTRLIHPSLRLAPRWIRWFNWPCDRFWPDAQRSSCTVSICRRGGRASCPLCGGEPEFATITPAADRLLICNRCTTHWPYDPLACPFCSNTDRSRITSFTSRDATDRIYACDVCRRYLKAYDGRHTTRPVMVAVDSVKTIPLDAGSDTEGVYRVGRDSGLGVGIPSPAIPEQSGPGPPRSPSRSAGALP